MARFILPVGMKDKWKWHLDGTRDNCKEYVWQVSATNGVDTYEFGFILFKWPGAKPRSGDLAMLIKAGQESLWHVSTSEDGKQNGGLIKGAGVSVEPNGENVIILLKGKENVERIFSSRSAKVIFQIQTPGQRPISDEVAVIYKD